MGLFVPFLTENQPNGKVSTDSVISGKRGREDRLKPLWVITHTNLWAMTHKKAKKHMNLVGYDPQERLFFNGYLVGYNPQFYNIYHLPL